MRPIRAMEDIEAGLSALRGIDPRLAPIIDAAGAVPLRLNAPGFSGLAQIIVAQMVSRASATAIWRRIEALGTPVTAASYLALPDETALGCGLSRGKAGTLMRVAQAAEAGHVDLDAVSALEATEAVKLLTGIKGIGPWTAEVYLMFCGGHPDVFPVGDVALQAAVAHAFDMEKRPSPKELAVMAAQWSPWRSVAARLFWAYYAVRMRRDGLPLL